MPGRARPTGTSSPQAEAAPAAPPDAPAAPPKRARRLQHSERKRYILEEATKHFADHGFDLSTPDLAKHLGIAQSLLYRYYASKQDLILDVYASLSPTAESYDHWIAGLRDRAVPLRDRLRRFYLSYAEEMWSYHRVRIMMWANLLQPALNRPYYDLMQDRVYPVIAEELRAAAGANPQQVGGLQREIEMIRSLHGAMFHLAAFRRWILSPPRFEGDLTPLIELKVDLFLRGAKDVLDWG